MNIICIALKAGLFFLENSLIQSQRCLCAQTRSNSFLMLPLTTAQRRIEVQFWPLHWQQANECNWHC